MNSMLKPYILAMLDGEVIKFTNKNKQYITEDLYLSILLSHNYPLLPMTVLFEVNIDESLQKCLLKLLESSEVILLTKYDSLYDFSYMQKNNFSKYGRFSLLHNKKFYKYLNDHNPLILTKQYSTTKHIETMMIDNGFNNIINKLKKSKRYNSNSLIYTCIDDLIHIVENRKHNSIVESTFQPILESSKFNRDFKNYVFRHVVNYNNDLYYNYYCKEFNAIIPYGLKSLLNSNSSLEEMNYHKEIYKRPANNLLIWRKIFNTLEINYKNCDIVLKLRITPEFIKIILKIKELLEETIPYTDFFELSIINIYNYLDFPQHTYIQNNKTEDIISSLNKFYELNTKSNKVKDKQYIQETLTIQEMHGDILVDNATKNIENKYSNSKDLKEVLNTLLNNLKNSNISNKEKIIEEFENKRLDNINILLDYIFKLPNSSTLPQNIVKIIKYIQDIL